MGATVKVVAAEAGAGLAARVAAELRRAGHAVVAAPPELPSPEGVLVFVDDPGLPAALRRMFELLPGRSLFPNAILVVEDASRAGGLLGEGFHDVVGPATAAAAVDALARGKPPVIFTALRREVEGDFLPGFVGEMRERAHEKRALVEACVDLVRAAAHLEKRIYRLRKLYAGQALDALLAQEGRVEGYLAALDERKVHRLGRLPSFPSAPASGGVLARREPRFKRAREEVDDAIGWLRQAGFLGALGKGGLEAMTETATTLADKPLQALRDCLAIVEREMAQRLAAVDRIQAQVDPIAVLEERCLVRYGFAILPPGIAVPDHVGAIMRQVVQPPAELYTAWCLDLRDLRLKPCGDVMDDLTRELAWTQEPSREPPERGRDHFGEETR